jgi:hypothetical protein
MPRKRIGVLTAVPSTRGGLAEKLTAELKADRDFGQSTVYEQKYSTGKSRVTVIWDEWATVSLEDRSDIVLRAYELAEGTAAREKIALATGLTISETIASGMLPYQIIPAVRKGDPVTREQAEQAFLEQGASQLVNPKVLQLRFTTKEEAESCRQRLIQLFLGRDDVWIINREMMSQDFE